MTADYVLENVLGTMDWILYWICFMLAGWLAGDINRDFIVKKSAPKKLDHSIPFIYYPLY